MPKFSGPCTSCQKPDPTGYYKKTLCNNCYRKQKRRERGLKKGGAVKVHTGPCTNCGSATSSNGRFVKGLCRTCYKRLKQSGHTRPRTKFNGPCTDCQQVDPNKRYFKHLCEACYKKKRYAEKVKSIKRVCIHCKKPISRLSRTGYCLNCRNAIRYATDPVYQEKIKTRNKLREVRKRGATESTLTAEQWQEVLNHFGNCCAYCCNHFDHLEIDHYIPLSKGGTHTQDNVVPACRSCNTKKLNGLPLRVVA